MRGGRRILSTDSADKNTVMNKLLYDIEYLALRYILAVASSF